MTRGPILGVLLSEHGSVSYDTRPGPRRAMLPGRSDQIRHHQLRDARGSVTLEGHATLVEVDPVRHAIGHAQPRRRGLGGFVVAFLERLAVRRRVRQWVRGGAGRKAQGQDRDSHHLHRSSPSHDLIPFIGLDFGSVFPSPCAPMGAVLFDRPTSRLVERGGAASWLRSSFMRARYSEAPFFKINLPRKIRWWVR